jgi:hypothetical protein
MYIWDCKFASIREVEYLPPSPAPKARAAESEGVLGADDPKAPPQSAAQDQAACAAQESDLETQQPAGPG